MLPSYSLGLSLPSRESSRLGFKKAAYNKDVVKRETP